MTLENQPVVNTKKAMGTLFLVVLLDLLGFGIIIPALPLYTEMFGGSSVLIGILFATFSACQFVATPMLGGLSDRFGRRPILFYSQLGSAFGFLLLGIATQFNWAHTWIPLSLIFASRIIDGISGGNISTAQAYIADILPPDKRSPGMAIIGMGFGIGFALGPLIGGVFGHHWIFMPGYIAAGLSLASAILTFVHLPESLRGSKTKANAAKWETYKPILLNKTSGGMMVVTFLGMSAFVMMETTIAIFLKDKLNWSMRETGFYLAYQGLIIIFVQGFVVRKIAGRISEWSLSIFGMAAVAFSMLCLTGVGVVGKIWLLGIAGTLGSAGRSLWQPSFSTLLSKHTPADRQGAVFGVYWGVSSVARVFAPIIAGWVYLVLKPGPFAMASVLLVICAGAIQGLKMVVLGDGV